MFNKTTSVFLSSILVALFVTGCSSENIGDKKDFNQQQTVERTDSGTESAKAATAAAVAASAGASAASTNAAAAQEKEGAVRGAVKATSKEGAPDAELARLAEQVEQKNVVYDPNKKYGSLWDSDLFNDKRFMLKIKLSAKEKKEAKILARSFEAHMSRAKLFMYYLLNELKERNLPAELAAVPLVESGFKPRAQSHAGAHGPWQFTRQTGKSFGLKVNATYDEFYDFIKSTDASLTYLEHLYKQLNNDWELALIAYNQGEFGVKKSIRRAKAAGVTKINASTIPLTKTARTYLKRIRAYADILHHPESYGVSHPEIENRIAFKQVQTGDQVKSMKEAAKLAGVDLETLKHLNAGYLTDALQSNRGLLVPVEHADQLEAAIDHRVKEQKTAQAKVKARSTGVKQLDQVLNGGTEPKNTAQVSLTNHNDVPGIHIH